MVTRRAEFGVAFGVEFRVTAQPRLALSSVEENILRKRSIFSVRRRDFDAARDFLILALSSVEERLALSGVEERLALSSVEERLALSNVEENILRKRSIFSARRRDFDAARGFLILALSSVEERLALSSVEENILRKRSIFSACKAGSRRS